MGGRGGRGEVERQREAARGGPASRSSSRRSAAGAGVSRGSADSSRLDIDRKQIFIAHLADFRFGYLASTFSVRPPQNAKDLGFRVLVPSVWPENACVMDF